MLAPKNAARKDMVAKLIDDTYRWPMYFMAVANL